VTTKYAVKSAYSIGYIISR